MPSDDIGRLIVRHADRRFYDPVERRYLAPQDIKRLVETGQRVVVLDADTGADVTKMVLASPR